MTQKIEMALSTSCTKDRSKIVQVEKHEKSLAPNSVTQKLCCTNDDSDPLFHQSVTQLSTVKLELKSNSHNDLCFLGCSLQVAVFDPHYDESNFWIAKPGNGANSTPVSSTATKHCNNVYNSFYAGTNKKIETVLQEMKTQLAHVENDISIIKGNNTSVKGMYTIGFFLFLLSCLSEMVLRERESRDFWCNISRFSLFLQKQLKLSFEKWKRNFSNCKTTSPPLNGTRRWLNVKTNILTAL